MHHAFAEKPDEQATILRVPDQTVQSFGRKSVFLARAVEFVPTPNEVS